MRILIAFTIGLAVVLGNTSTSLAWESNHYGDDSEWHHSKYKHHYKHRRDDDWGRHKRHHDDWEHKKHRYGEDDGWDHQKKHNDSDSWEQPKKHHDSDSDDWGQKKKHHYGENDSSNDDPNCGQYCND